MTVTIATDRAAENIAIRDDRRPHKAIAKAKASRVTADFAVATATRVRTVPIVIHAGGRFSAIGQSTASTAACNSRRTSGTCAATGAIACGRAGAAGFPSPTGAPSAPRRARSQGSASASSSTGYDGRPGLGRSLGSDASALLSRRRIARSPQKFRNSRQFLTCRCSCTARRTPASARA